MTCLKSQSWEEAEPGSWAAEFYAQETDRIWEQQGQGGRGPAGRGAAARLEMSELIQTP